MVNRNPARYVVSLAVPDRDECGYTTECILPHSRTLTSPRRPAEQLRQAQTLPLTRLFLTKII